MAKLTVRRVADAIRLYKGNVSAVAQSFERSRTAVYNFVRRHSELAQALIDAREAMKDNVESRFHLDCLKDEPAYQTSRIFFLKTLAKDRGYVERIEQSGPDGGPIPMTLDLRQLNDEQLITLHRLLELASRTAEAIADAPAAALDGQSGAGAPEA
jgi:hypothetical protein